MSQMRNNYCAVNVPPLYSSADEQYPPYGRCACFPNLCSDNREA